MALSVGDRLGHYDVTALLGEGGMGQVYRATDTQLHRDVALKILPDAFAADPDRLARFQREAQVLASLNHPGIAAIYGIEQSDDTRALVLELVEGPTLADRIAEGPVPLGEALPIAKQIAEALEAAHEAGVIHRDLKPANIKVREDGTVKVLDFGLAKALDSTPTGDPSQSPTLTGAATKAGVIMGTAAYMSPEQARGKTVDKRADIWAFGAVVFEMFTGRRVFEGDDTSLTLSKVLQHEPDWTLLPGKVTPSLTAYLRRCLEKDAQRRVRDIGDVRMVLEGAFDSPPAGKEAVADGAPRGKRELTPMLWALAAFVVGGILAGAAAWSLRPGARQEVTKLWLTSSVTEPLSPSAFDADLDITPDGRLVVYTGASEGTRQLHVRRLDTLEATPLRDLGTPRSPFLSPDGDWVGYFDSTLALRRVSVLGGPPVTICPMPDGAPRGASWAADGTIVFAGSRGGSGLWRVSSSGGEPELLTTADTESGELDHLWPHVLPGGEAVLFTILRGGGVEQGEIALLDLESREYRALLPGGTRPRYSISGHVVFGIEGTLRAVPFDLDRLEITGEPVPVVEGVNSKSTGVVDFGIADDGSLIYVTADPDAIGGPSLVWVDREGREESAVSERRTYVQPRISPDGSRVAVDIRDQEQDIWMLDVGRQALTRFTFDPAADLYPVWMPDSQRLLFGSRRDGPAQVFAKAADGTGVVERLTDVPNELFPHTVSEDLERIVTQERAPGTGADLTLVATGGGSASEPLIATEFTERNAEISPNGAWLVYEADPSGRLEVWVKPFPNVDEGTWQISTSGGTRPAWAPDGREIFYLDPAGRLMRVDVELGASFTHGVPEVLLEGPYSQQAPGRTYDIAPDGERFLMIRDRDIGDMGRGEQVVIVENWFEELSRLAPVN